MIQLTENYFITQGMYQKCYIHPSHPNLCIKIPKPVIEVDRVLKELKYYKYLNNKKALVSNQLFFSKYLNSVTTNLGEGHIFELVRDQTTGNISKTLEYYLMKEPELLKKLEVAQHYKELIKTLVTHKIVMSDIWARNICCQFITPAQIQLVIIDGLGHRDFIPFSNWFSYFTKKKMHRKMLKNSMLTLEDQKKFLML